MKTLFISIAAFLTLGAVALPLTSCRDGNDFTPRNMLQLHNGDGNTDINLADCQFNLNNLPVENLSEAEKASLLFMREEEKLARDAYIKFYDKWGLNVFNNIQSSEQTHMDAVLQLIQKYYLTDPVGANSVGVFADDSLQALYNQLIPIGEQSVVNALSAGALIEEVDIVDLKNALNGVVDNQDIRLVYDNLGRASRNHLRAMVRNLANRGVTYVPQRLSQSEYEAIINGDWETGN